jgi:hypothetical protein
MRRISERLNDRIHFRNRYAKPIHAGVNLQMDGVWSANPAGTDRGSHGTLEMTELIDAGDRRSETMLNQAALFAGPEPGENQNRLANATGTKLGALRHRGDAEPIRAGFCECFGDGDGAVAVRVGLYDGEDFAAAANLAPDGAEVFGDRAEGNLGPHRTPVKLNASHHPSQDSSLVQNAAPENTSRAQAFRFVNRSPREEARRRP